MTNSLFFKALMGFCIVLFGNYYANAQKVKLPIEVLGPEGTIVETKINLSSSEASNASRLWLQVNNLSYEGKGSISINNGRWYKLTNTSVIMQPQAKARGGMVHGGFNTIRFTIPAAGVKAGENSIRFRFNFSDGISIGYRIVNMTFKDGSGTVLVPNSRFYHEDPNSWKAPLTGQDAVTKGKELWYNANLWNHYLPAGKNGSWYGQKLPSTRPIKAKCASCHTQDGRDLEMFSYSNKSIIARAKFHKLSETQGKQIAAYIRSLSDSKANVARHGRPWNPPYQPGPSLKDKPIGQWAAGAGLDAVLEEDKDMLPYLFPKGVSKETVLDYFDSDKMDDRTILPVAIQFPDWKHWLPMIHPIDAYSRNNYFVDPNRKNKPQEAIDNLRAYLAEKPPASRNKQQLISKIYHLWPAFRGFLAEGSAKVTNGEHWRTKDGSAIKHLGVDVPKEFAATSLARLLAVKNFEFNVEYDLQDKAKWFVDAEDQPAERQWPNKTYSVFEVPPHFQACVDNSCQNFTGQPIETGRFESTAWYNLQFVLNGGNGFAGSVVPTDFNYHSPFILRASESSGIPEPLRYYSALNQMYQIRSWSGSKKGPTSGKGFRIRNQGPWHFYGIDDGNNMFKNGTKSWLSGLDNIKPGLALWALEAQLLQFLKEVKKPENSLENWERQAPNGGSAALDPEDKKSVKDITTFRKFSHYADKMYYIIPKFKDEGVDCSIMNSLIDWCQAAWPLINWGQFREDTASNTCATVKVPTVSGAQSDGFVTIIKGSATAFAIDGGNSAQVAAANAKLWSKGNGTNPNQYWVEIPQGNGYYSYMKAYTNLSLDGGNGGRNGQLVKLASYDAKNQNQHWKKIAIGNNKFVLQKRSAPRYAIDGGWDGKNGQAIQLWELNKNNINQQWIFDDKSRNAPTLLIKRNNPRYALDGGWNGATNQKIQLWEKNSTHQNHQWIEIPQGEGYYSYLKIGTNFAIDGGSGGKNGQLVKLYRYNSKNQNQHWKKVKVGNTTFQLLKRNAPNFALDGSNNNDNFNGKQLKLWSAKTDNQNQHWVFSAGVIKEVGKTEADFTNNKQWFLYPTMVDNQITIQGLEEGGSYSVVIFDQSGKRVLAHSINNQNSNILDVRQMASGMYFMRILADNNSQQLLKFVKR